METASVSLSLLRTEHVKSDFGLLDGVSRFLLELNDVTTWGEVTSGFMCGHLTSGLKSLDGTSADLAFHSFL